MDQRQETIEMLHELYQASAMGEEGTRLLLEKTENEQIACELRKYGEEYLRIKNEAASQLADYKEKPRDTGAFQKTSQWMGVQIQTLFDNTPSHIAEMLIQGSTMGIIKGEKNKHRNENAENKAIKLSDQLMKLEQDYIDTMKLFLA